MRKGKPAPSTKHQVSVRAGGAQQNADPLLGKLFCMGGRWGGIFSYFAARSLLSTNEGRERGLGVSSHPRPDKQQGQGELGGLRRCPGVTGAPGKASVGALCRDSVTSRVPGDRPPPTPFPTGRGGGGCSVGSQSRDQYYKAHPLGGSGNWEGRRWGGESQSTFCFFTEPSRARPV